MHVLAVIPARAGSKGIPGKNIRPLNGRPLLAYSVDAARESRTVTRVVVSTDDEEIARVAREAGAEVPFLRPAALAGDAVPMLDTLQQVVAALKSADAYCPDIIVLLQPTSPLRTAAHVDAAVTLLLETSADSVVSVVDVPHQFQTP
jgi:CMP-N-acetylneuraminic acid synthetase